MPDFGRCGEPTCSQISVRLFDCAHHCLKMVCLQHLIEHDRLFERNKKQLESHQGELKRLYSIYSALIDENKLRSEYEQKLSDHKKLVGEVTAILKNDASDAERVRSIIDKLKKMINDKQKQSDDSLTIVKVEPIDENVSSRDDSIYIGFDRLQNLVIDTDYHRRKASENATIKNKSDNKPITEDEDDDDDYNFILDAPNPRVAATCPLWFNGAYGLYKNHHCIRLCRKKNYNDLSNHIRQFHGLLTPVANIIARAVHARIPTTKCLFPNDLQVVDSRRSFLCPFRSQCSTSHWLPGICLKSHLIEAHRMSAATAELKMITIRKLNKSKPMSKIRSQIIEIAQEVESIEKRQQQL